MLLLLKIQVDILVFKDLGQIGGLCLEICTNCFKIICNFLILLKTDCIYFNLSFEVLKLSVTGASILLHLKFMLCATLPPCLTLKMPNLYIL